MKKITHFTHKQHPLKLVSYKGERDGVVVAKCPGCGKDLAAGQTSYACRFCRFYLHEPCAKLPQQLQHFFHSCPLFLRKNQYFTCNSCFQSHSSVFAYRCEPCDFDMDVECAFEFLSLSSSQGKIEHFCHRHPLQPLEETSSLPLLCQICHKMSSSGPFWSCEPCDFHVHKHCLAMLPQKVQTKLHSRLVSLVLKASPSTKCIHCKRVGDLAFIVHRSSRAYMCISCCLVGRMVDDSPSHLPKVLDHFLHPCTVRLVFSPFSTCNACFRSGGESCDFFYNCKDCDFFLHLECAQPPPTHSQPDQIQHFCHLHPLELFRDIDDSSFLCRLCESSCSSKSFYGCRKCQFYIHQPCMEILPQKTIHRLLSQTIVLLTVPSFECTTCNRACSGLTYLCRESRCNFCVKCVLWPENEFGQSGEFKSIHHWHPLAIGEIDKVDQARCFMCREYCSGQIYICSQCEIFFHKQCAELPQELWTPLHPEHPLSLVNESLSNESRRCSLCLKGFPMNSFRYNGSYRCKECRFKLDSFCACLLPSVRHQHHEHLLTVVENMHIQRSCSACHISCTGVTLACSECRSFYLHLECGPLPCTIKSTFHIHSLTLEDYYAEDNEADKFACHVCEEERNPRLPVYCCIEDCLMVCDVKCLVPELLPIVRGEHGCVVTRTTFPNVACEIVSKKMVLEEKKMSPTSEIGAREGNSESKYEFNFNDLHESFVNSALEEEEEEEEEETLGIEFLEAEYEENDILSTKDEDIDQKDESRETKAMSKDDGIVGEDVGRQISSYETSYVFSLEALSSFQNQLHCPPQHYLKWYFKQRFEDGRMIGDYALPSPLYPLYEQLFGKHKIIDDKFKLSYPKKRYLIFLACSVVDDMRRCKVVDLTKEGILCWLGWIKYVEDEGSFDLRFVAESIKRLWKAHYVIEAKRLVDEKSNKLRQRLEKLSKEEDDLTKKLEATRKKIQETKKEEMAHKEYRAAGASRLKKQYKEALEIKWKPSSDCILKYPDYAESSLTK